MTIDIRELGQFLPSANRDARRIALFGMAAQKKSLELATREDMLREFVVEAGRLIYKWINAPKKWSLADLFRDPYKSLREETRQFARRWELDPEFVRELG